MATFIENPTACELQFLYKNIRSQKANNPRQILLRFDCDQFNHPLNRTNLAPSGFHFFFHLNVSTIFW